MFLFKVDWFGKKGLFLDWFGNKVESKVVYDFSILKLVERRELVSFFIWEYIRFFVIFLGEALKKVIFYMCFDFCKISFVCLGV